MLSIIENKSQTWFKVLSPERYLLETNISPYNLPTKSQKGSWFQSITPSGIMLVSDPKDFIQTDDISRVFIAEYQGKVLIERDGVIWVLKARLVKEANDMDLRRFGIFTIPLPKD